MTLWALMFERPIPAPDHLLIASSVVHRFSPCVNLTEPSLSVYHFVPPRILCPDGFFRASPPRRGDSCLRTHPINVSTADPHPKLSLKFCLDLARIDTISFALIV